MSVCSGRMWTSVDVWRPRPTRCLSILSRTSTRRSPSRTRSSARLLAGASANAGTSTLSNDAVSQVPPVMRRRHGFGYPILTTYDNAPTNSGRLVGAQFNDGGFGDVGLQWKKVNVRGSVTAVHNSLAVQPNNNGQGLITVQGIQFPASPAPSPRPRESGCARPNNPPVIASDGNSVTKKAAETDRPSQSVFFDSPEWSRDQDAPLFRKLSASECGHQQRADPGRAVQRGWIRRRRTPVAESPCRRWRPGRA